MFLLIFLANVNLFKNMQKYKYKKYINMKTYKILLKI